ncbi:peptidase inhibitor family I36 protein [Jiangella asiatica]|nr:peptidase inhibitor family I36 protein [Jiangella asiatica]
MARRRTMAALVGMVVALAATSTGARAVESDATDLTVSASGPLAAELTEALEQLPGGVQVSDNAIAWDGGEIIAVWPDPGEEAAPAGLGDGVREDVVAQLGLTDLADLSDPEAGAVQPRGSASSCPSGYYCFYTSTNFDGARYQFSSTCSGYASSYGFDNATSSWVNRTSSRTLGAYDSQGGTRLWTMSPNASSSYVGSADDNRMSYWTCS